MIWEILLWTLVIVGVLPLVNLIIGVHPPRFSTNDDPGRHGLRYEPVSFPTSDGLTLRGWFIPAAHAIPTFGRPGAPAGCATILFGHGYPFDKANILGHAVFLHEEFNLLVMDFRYFGESEGAYTTVGVHEGRDVAAAVAYVKTRREVDPTRIGAMGFSLSAATFILARHPEVKAIVADSPYASLEQVIARQFFIFPGPTKWPLVALTRLYAKVLLGIDVREAAPAEAVRQLKVPLFLIHGGADSQIPAAHSRQIAVNADPATTELWVVPHADHGHAHALEEHQYEVRVSQFFHRHLCVDAGPTAPKGLSDPLDATRPGR